MRTDNVVLNLNGFEHRLMINSLVHFRNDLLSDDRPTEDVEDLILKVIDAPPERRSRRRCERAAR